MIGTYESPDSLIAPRGRYTGGTALVPANASRLQVGRGLTDQPAVRVRSRGYQPVP